MLCENVDFIISYLMKSNLWSALYGTGQFYVICKWQKKPEYIFKRGSYNQN